MSRLSSRALSQSAVLLACTLCWCCVTPALAQGTYNWNTTSGTWNTTDANWSGAGPTWVNGASSNAVFNNTSGATVTIGESITAGDVSFGDTSTNNFSWTLSSGSLSVAGNLAFQGWNNNGPFYDANPRLTVNSNVDVAGSTLIGRATLAINSGTFTTNRITTNPASADWARFSMFGGSVTATNGIDGTYGTNGTNGTTATFDMLLQGGTLSTTYIKVADRENSGNAWLTLNSTLVRALTSTSSFIQTYGGGSNVFIAASGAYFDSNGFDIGVDRTLVNYPGQAGFLVKQGSGTLTLSGNNSYSNGTTVSGGSLIAGSANAFGSGGVTVNGGIASLAGYTVTNGFTLTSGTLLGTTGTNGVGSIAVASGVIAPPGAGSMPVPSPSEASEPVLARPRPSREMAYWPPVRSLFRATQENRPAPAGDRPSGSPRARSRPPATLASAVGRSRSAAAAPSPSRARSAAAASRRTLTGAR